MRFSQPSVAPEEATGGTRRHRSQPRVAPKEATGGTRQPRVAPQEAAGGTRRSSGSSQRSSSSGSSSGQQQSRPQRLSSGGGRQQPGSGGGTQSSGQRQAVGFPASRSPQARRGLSGSVGNGCVAATGRQPDGSAEHARGCRPQGVTGTSSADSGPGAGMPTEGRGDGTAAPLPDLDDPEGSPESPSQGCWEESVAAREFAEFMEFV